MAALAAWLRALQFPVPPAPNTFCWWNSDASRRVHKAVHIPQDYLAAALCISLRRGQRAATHVFDMECSWLMDKLRRLTAPGLLIRLLLGQRRFQLRRPAVVTRCS